MTAPITAEWFTAAAAALTARVQAAPGPAEVEMLGKVFGAEEFTAAEVAARPQVCMVLGIKPEDVQLAGCRLGLLRDESAGCRLRLVMRQKRIGGPRSWVVKGMAESSKSDGRN